MARSGTVTHAPWRKGQPQTPYQANLSVRIAHRNPKGTATNTKSSEFLCSNSPFEPERDSHKHQIKRFSLFELLIGTRKGHPQTPYRVDFSVRIAHRNPEGTSTNTISSSFLCSNGPLGTGSWPAWLSWRHSRNCQLYLVSRLALSGMRAIGGRDYL